MKVELPDPCLVVLIGVSGSGKSTFCGRHFRASEVVSSDMCRLLVADDDNDQSATGDAFEVLHAIAGTRLRRGRLTVVDATSVRAEDRRPLVELARRHHLFAVAVVLDVPQDVCRARNAERPDRDFGNHVIRNQHSALRRSLKGIRREGFQRVFVLHGEQEIGTVEVARHPLWTDRRAEAGPFDVIGDVHGCHRELVELLTALGWTVAPDGMRAAPPDGRRAVFLGDLVDRGPASPAVLRLVMNMVADGVAMCLPGNHEIKLLRALDGRDVQRTHGLAETLEQLDAEPAEFRDAVRSFIDGLVGHAVLDGGALVVAHAGLPEAMHGRSSGAVRAFSLFGDTTGETDEFGLPVRYPWAEDYRGAAAVVYGHTPVPAAVWTNGTICIDTGCVFGGALSALRWPERELVAVAAHATYYEPVRPLAAPVDQQRPPGVLDLDDVAGKRIVDTRLNGTVTVREEQAAAALEVMSRFAVDPHWLVYLPPTMSPPETTSRHGLLEHPAEAFDAYRQAGVVELVAEEKHMGSRAVVVVGRDADVIAERFGVPGSGAGAVFTRTGRPFFGDPEIEAQLLKGVRGAFDELDLWTELATGWAVLDCELMPWSAKALDLLRTQYASIGAAASATLGAEADVLQAAAARVGGMDEALGAAIERRELAARFVAAYRRYCWPTDGLAGLRLAPFQVLATEGRVRALDPHPWHLDVADRLAGADPSLFQATRSVRIALGDERSEQAAIEWWEALTADGGEGMVVKPVDVVVSADRGVAQPGIKCRGPEYLRIIYGPEYTRRDQLRQLRSRGVSHKRSLALREFALGIEALERFVRGEPLHRVHECVFGVLAMESEPVDPRL